MTKSARTDLAAEAQRVRQRSEQGGRLPDGVRLKAETLHGLPVQAVHIESEAGSRALGKPRGRYYSLALPQRSGRGSEDFAPCVLAMRELIGRCLGRQPDRRGGVLFPDPPPVSAGKGELFIDLR